MHIYIYIKYIYINTISYTYIYIYIYTCYVDKYGLWSLLSLAATFSLQSWSSEHSSSTAPIVEPLCHASVATCQGQDRLETTDSAVDRRVECTFCCYLASICIEVHWYVLIIQLSHAIPFVQFFCSVVPLWFEPAAAKTSCAPAWHGSKMGRKCSKRPPGVWRPFAQESPGKVVFEPDWGDPRCLLWSLGSDCGVHRSFGAWPEFFWACSKLCHAPMTKLDLGLKVWYHCVPPILPNGLSQSPPFIGRG